MSYAQGQFMNSIMSRVTQVRTTAKGRIDQIRARVQGMGVGTGGMFKGILPRGTAPIKTYSQGLMQGPRMLDRFRQTRVAPNTGAARPTAGALRPGQAPIQTYNRPTGAPIKTFSKENLRAIKTF